jgi:hypothetical protein
MFQLILHMEKISGKESSEMSTYYDYSEHKLCIEM